MSVDTTANKTRREKKEPFKIDFLTPATKPQKEIMKEIFAPVNKGGSITLPHYSKSGKKGARGTIVPAKHEHRKTKSSILNVACHNLFPRARYGRPRPRRGFDFLHRFSVEDFGIRSCGSRFRIKQLICDIRQGRGQRRSREYLVCHVWSLWDEREKG